MGLFALLPLGFLHFNLRHVSTFALVLIAFICLGVFSAKLRAAGSPRVPPTGKWWLALMGLASCSAMLALGWPDAPTYMLPPVGVAVFAVAMLERYFRYRLAKRRILKRRMQQARWRRAKRAVLSEWKERLRWLAGVQHDMRQPLHALGLLVRHPSIVNGSEQVNGRGLSSSQVVMQLLSCHRWLQELAENTLEATRLELGEQRENDIKHISSTDLCESLVDWIKQLALSKGLEFQVQVEECQITTDLRRLKRVLGNLLFNAVEHTYEGKISFHYKRMGGVHQFEIKDTGPGLDEKIMNPEGGASSSFGSDLPKTGLGLYVVKRLCREMEWNLSLINELHSGSKFVLELADRIPGQFVGEAPPIFKAMN